MPDADRPRRPGGARAAGRRRHGEGRSRAAGAVPRGLEGGPPPGAAAPLSRDRPDRHPGHGRLRHSRRRLPPAAGAGVPGAGAQPPPLRPAAVRRRTHAAHRLQLQRRHGGDGVGVRAGAGDAGQEARDHDWGQAADRGPRQRRPRLRVPLPGRAPRGVRLRPDAPPRRRRGAGADAGRGSRRGGGDIGDGGATGAHRRGRAAGGEPREAAGGPAGRAAARGLRRRAPHRGGPSLEDPAQRVDEGVGVLRAAAGGEPQRYRLVLAAAGRSPGW